MVNTTTRASLPLFKFHATVHAISFSPDGKYVVNFQSNDCLSKMWNWIKFWPSNIVNHIVELLCNALTIWLWAFDVPWSTGIFEVACQLILGVLWLLIGMICWTLNVLFYYCSQCPDLLKETIHNLQWNVTCLINLSIVHVKFTLFAAVHVHPEDIQLNLVILWNCRFLLDNKLC